MEEKGWSQKDWLELCGYLHKEIMGYDESMKFSQFMALRLRGLSKGQFVANNNRPKYAEYSYKTILYTLKVCKRNILSGFMNNKTKFNSERHKFNYAMAIVESEINDVVMRLKRAKRAEEKADKIDLSNRFNDSAEYKKKTKEINKNLKDLW